jgi:hypothetical protein
VGTLADAPPPIDPDWRNNEPDNNKGKGAGLQGKASKKAKAALREANQHRDTAQFDVVGMADAEPGQTVLVRGWGEWDGLYFLESVRHSIIPVFVTQLSLRKELASKGY